MSSDQEEQYGTDANLAARQRLWASCRREPPDGFSLFDWVLDLAELQHDSELAVLDAGCGNGLYEQAGRPWDEIVDRATDLAAETMDGNGRFLAEVCGDLPRLANAARSPRR